MYCISEVGGVKLSRGSGQSWAILWRVEESLESFAKGPKFSGQRKEKS